MGLFKVLSGIFSSGDDPKKAAENDKAWKEHLKSVKEFQDDVENQMKKIGDNTSKALDAGSDTIGGGIKDVADGNFKNLTFGKAASVVLLFLGTVFGVKEFIKKGAAPDPSTGQGEVKLSDSHLASLEAYKQTKAYGVIFAKDDGVKIGILLESGNFIKDFDIENGTWSKDHEQADLTAAQIEKILNRSEYKENAVIVKQLQNLVQDVKGDLGRAYRMYPDVKAVLENAGVSIITPIASKRDSTEQIKDKMTYYLMDAALNNAKVQGGSSEYQEYLNESGNAYIKLRNEHPEINPRDLKKVKDVYVIDSKEFVFSDSDIGRIKEYYNDTKNGLEKERMKRKVGKEIGAIDPWSPELGVDGFCSVKGVKITGSFEPVRIFPANPTLKQREVSTAHLLNTEPVLS